MAYEFIECLFSVTWTEQNQKKCNSFKKNKHKVITREHKLLSDRIFGAWIPRPIQILLLVFQMNSSLNSEKNSKLIMFHIEFKH